MCASYTPRKMCRNLLRTASELQVHTPLAVDFLWVGRGHKIDKTQHTTWLQILVWSNQYLPLCMDCLRSSKHSGPHTSTSHNKTSQKIVGSRSASLTQMFALAWSKGRTQTTTTQKEEQPYASSAGTVAVMDVLLDGGADPNLCGWWSPVHRSPQRNRVPFLGGHGVFGGLASWVCLKSQRATSVAFTGWIPCRFLLQPVRWAPEHPNFLRHLHAVVRRNMAGYVMSILHVEYW